MTRACFFVLHPMTPTDIQSSGVPPVPAPPSRLYSIVYGALGGMVLSVAGFVPWAVTGRVLYRAVGEAGLYARSFLSR
jgi:hypothetical protein